MAVRRVMVGGRLAAAVVVAPTPAVGLEWLVRLRWVAAAGQTAAVLVAAHGFGASLPTAPLLGLVALAAVSNAGLTWWLRQRGPGSARLLAAALMLDTALLTAMLWLAGGASNPFTVFYLVHVVLAALLLDARWTIALAAFSSLGFGALFFAPVDHSHHMMHGDFSSHLQGMWISYTLAAGFIGYFVWRLARALEDRERQIDALRRTAARSERLASLSALAAGAAHELGSPLGTIAVAARELERACDAPLDAAAVREDATLLRGQAERCRLILDRLAARAGESAGEAPGEATTGELAAEVRSELGRSRAERLAVDDACGGVVRAPRRALVQALVNLVQNAFDAVEPQGADGRVSLRIEGGAGGVTWIVRDNGPGVAPVDLERLGEPFFTTKPPGRGMGLGLYLAGSFAERLGGHLELTSTPAQGTTAALHLPLEAA